MQDALIRGKQGFEVIKLRDFPVDGVQSLRQGGLLSAERGQCRKVVTMTCMDLLGESLGKSGE